MNNKTLVDKSQGFIMMTKSVLVLKSSGSFGH